MSVRLLPMQEANTAADQLSISLYVGSGLLCQTLLAFCQQPTTLCSKVEAMLTTVCYAYLMQFHMLCSLLHGQSCC